MRGGHSVPGRIVGCQRARTQGEAEGFMNWSGHDLIKRTFMGTDFALADEWNCRISPRLLWYLSNS